MKKFFLLFAISALFQLTAYSANTNLAFSSTTRYASAANNAALNVTAGHSVTITLWVKITSASATGKYFVCKRLNGAGDGYEFYQTATNPGYFAVNVYSAGTSIGPAAGTLYKINDGNWHHQAYVLDATNNASSIYVDSKLEKTLAITHAQAIAGITNTDKLYFGLRPLTTKTLPMTSPMDEVRIYDMAMTPADLLTDMATTVTSGTTNLTAAWNFNEGSGTTLADIKTTNPATITGTPTWATATLAASPAIVMAATLSKSPSDADFSPASATPTAISYSSSNTAVATVVNGNIHIVSPGTLYSTSTITASQPASLYYNAGSATSALTINPYCVIASTVATDGPYGLLNGTVNVNGVLNYTLTPYSTPNWKFSDEAASKFTVNRGQTITLNVNGGANTAWGDAYAYCDWNGDGVFNTSDERTAIYINNGAQATGKTVTFTVPQTAVLGDIAMRIKADEAPSFNGYTPGDPCSNMKNGTVHTIRFTVAAAVVTPAALTFPNAITSYASAADNAALNVTAGHSVTITAWVKTTSATNQMFVCKRVNGAGDGYELYQSGAYFAVNASSSGTDISPAVGTLYPINDGNWHHVAYVLNVTGTTSSIYVDGKLEKTLQITAGQAGAGITNTDALYFGVRNTTTKTLPLNGSLDEVRIYDKAMTPADLLTDMAVTAAVGTANLTAAWDFNEGSGTTLADVKSINPATITGSVTWPLITAVAPPAITMGAGLGKLASDADFSPASATPTAVQYTLSTNPAVATIVNGNVHIVGAGASSITASQAANLMYTAGTNVTTVLNVYASSSYCVIASSVNTDLGYGLKNGTVSVGGVTKYTLPTNVGGQWQYVEGASQFTVNRGTTITLTVNGNSNTAYGDGYAYFDWNNDGAFNTSDERKTIYTNNGGIVTNKSITITVPLTAVLGDIAMRIKADEAPSFNGYTPGDPCSNMKNGTCNTIKFTIAAAPQTITFGAITAKTYGDADFTLAATASSSLAVSYVSSDPTVATVDAASGLVHILKAGTTTITASQAGDATYAAATPAGQLLTIIPASTTISSNTNLSACGLTDDQLANTNLSISSGEFVIDATKTVQSLTIAPGAKLTLSDGNTLSIAGSFTLQSDATGNATLLDNGGTISAASTNVEQYLTSGRNWYISSPISAATSNVFSATAENPVYWYDEAHGSTTPWPTITNTTTDLTVMKGYVANLAASGVVTFSGSLNTGAKSITVYRTTGQAKEGFNLVGNPYPSYLDWDNVTKTNLSTTLWYRTKTTPAPVTSATSYVFDTYNATGRVGTSLGAKKVTNCIPPMQAFWVRVDAGQTSGTLAVTNAQRSHKDSTLNTFKSKSIASQSLLRLEVSNGVNSDQALVYFNTSASNGLDSYDSPKMSNETASIPEIYTLAGTDQVVINGVNDMTQFALGFTTGEANNFTIKASLFTGFASGTQIILRDNLMSNEQDLTLGDYSFYSDVTANNETRFTVLFKAPSIATGINQNSNSNVWISLNGNNQIVVNGANGESTVAVYNAVGQRIYSSNLTNTTKVLNNTLTSGVYMVTVTNSGKSVTQKVIIK